MSTRALPTKFLDPGCRTTESEVLLHSLTKPLLRPSATRGDNRVATTDLDSLFHWTELPDGAAWWILDGYMHTSHVCQNIRNAETVASRFPTWTGLWPSSPQKSFIRFLLQFFALGITNDEHGGPMTKRPLLRKRSTKRSTCWKPASMVKSSVLHWELRSVTPGMRNLSNASVRKPCCAAVRRPLHRRNHQGRPHCGPQ